MAAMTQLLAEKGYAAVTIGELARHAGVSRAAFYEHFGDKEDCLLAAYDRFRVAILESLTGELTDETTYGDFVDRALDGYLGLLEREPAAAKYDPVALRADITRALAQATTTSGV